MRTLPPPRAALAMFFGSTIRFIGASSRESYRRKGNLTVGCAAGARLVGCRPTLQQPGAFDVEVAVDEGDGQLRGLDVQAQRAPPRELAEGELAVAQVIG